MSEEVEVHSTARWPDRLEQVATLLRAEGAAILALQDDDIRTLFSYRLDATLSWREVLGEDAVQRALVDRAGFTAAIPADRWGESVAYALLAPITSTGSDRGVLCALRHTLPFDAVEVVAAEAAARLLSMAFADAQAALGGRYGAPEVTVGGHEATTTTEVAVSSATTEDVTPPLRVAVVESQPATRLGLETFLERAGLTVAVSCATVAEAVARLAGARCDVAILGTLSDAAVADAVKRVRDRSRVPVVVVTDVRRGMEAHAGLRAGASGQLARDAAPATIVTALQAAASGLAVVEPSVLDAMLHPPGIPAGSPLGARDDSADTPEIVEGALGSAVGPEAAATAGERSPRRIADAPSPRELELLRYLAEGYTNKEIARVMVLADDTVKKGVQALIAKLGAADRTHAVVLALRSGLIE